MTTERKYDKNGFDENGYNKYGYDKFGYDRQGRDKDGFDRRGFDSDGFNKLTGLNKEGFNRNGFDKDGFDCYGYNVEGYDRDGYNRSGFDRDGFDVSGFNANGFGRDGFDSEGFNKSGYNRLGFNRQGFDIDGYDSEGYDFEGYDRIGYDRSGYDPEGYDQNGFDRDGFDKNGYDTDGFDIRGYNREGYNIIGYNAEGYDIYGYNKEGFNKFGFNSSGYDIDGYNSDGFNVDGFNREGYDLNGFDRDGFGAEGFNSSGYNREGFNKDGFDKSGYNNKGYDKCGFNREGYNEEGYDQNGYDRLGYDNKGYDKEGFNSEGYNRNGFDRNGYNKEGYDKYGFDLDGYDIDGFDIYGRDQDGFGLHGYDRFGFNKEGINQDGFYKDDFDELGYNIFTGLNSKGYDREGYNINGINIYGFDRNGFDTEGFNRDGYDCEGYNRNGRDRKGFDHKGFDKNGYNKQGYDIYGYDANGFDKNGYNRLGFDKEGYDRNGLNISGKRKSIITSPEQIKTGLRIKSKKNGERGKIDGVGKTHVYFTMDKDIGADIYSKTSKNDFMQLFFIDDDGLGSEHERESLYNTKVRRYLYSDYCRSVLIPAEKEKTVLSERKYYDKYGIINFEAETYDELKLKLRAEKEAKKIAENAYFAHVDYIGDPNLYIGKKEIPGYVVDWADKRAAYYYEYKVFVIDRKLGIRFVRNITLKDGLFSEFHDLYNTAEAASGGSIGAKANVADEKLIEIIERNRNSKSIHDIVESIQAKQYEIITQNMNKSLLVLGCAGSGKTMILLHRIRYILFNNPTVNENSLAIVSPTDILGRESRELSKILNIDKVKQYSTATFYLDTVKNIFKSIRLFHRAKELRVCENRGEGQNGSTEICSRIIEGSQNEKKQYILNTKNELSLEKKQIIDIMGKPLLKKVSGYYLSAKKEIALCSEKDIESIISYITNRIEKELYVKENREYSLICLTEAMRKGTSRKEEYDNSKIRRRLQRLFTHIDKTDFKSIESIEISAQNAVTRFVQIISLLSGEKDPIEIKQMIDDIKSLSYGEIEHLIYQIEEEVENLRKLDLIREGIELSRDVVDLSFIENTDPELSMQSLLNRFQNLINLMETVSKIRKQTDINPLVFIEAYNDIENEIEILNRADVSNDYVFDMLTRMLGAKRDRKSGVIDISKQQLQSMFHILLEKYTPNDERKLCIFLDEFQDYSVAELSDIRNYNSNAVINLFGDVNQCINSNGITDVDILKDVLFFDGIYELKENYRNASEITAYVNKRFGMDMYRIGLPGSVIESDSVAIRDLENGDRAAIIVADERMISKLEPYFPDQTVRYYYKEGSILNNYYNVLTVAQAKGLEFEKVIVVSTNMTNNQLYVACTRTIRDLDIVVLQL